MHIQHSLYPYRNLTFENQPESGIGQKIKETRTLDVH